MTEFADIFGIRYRQQVKLVSLPAPDKHRHLAGLRIGQLSDFHRGPLVSARYISRGAAALMDYQPDLIALTGDFVMRAGYARSCAAALSALSAPLGVYAVPGNHDYWSGDIAAVMDSLRDVGISVLINEAVAVPCAAGSLAVAGVDDLWAGRPDISLALAGAADGAPVILLSHAPDYADTAARHGIWLQLSGHSHGGQVRLPWGPVLLPKYARKYSLGLQHAAGTGTLVYTNAGLGAVFPHLRLNCPPEITVLDIGEG